MDVQTSAAVVAIAWIAVWAVLQLEHALWSGVDFKWRYIMGLGTACLGCAAVGIAMSDLALIIVPSALATAGLPILLTYAHEAHDQRKQEAAQKRGELAGMARGIHKALSQEAIDRGDDPSRN
jgi:CHASE2 domain-containing sensor protein